MADLGAVVQTNDLGSEVLPTALQYYYEAFTTRHYYQRILTMSAGWVYYTMTAVNAAPGPTETTPNNAGDFVSGTHSVLLVSRQ